MKKEGKNKCRRRFITDSFEHIYQRSIDKDIIFYTIEDCLVFFTLVCTQAINHNITLASLCIMLNHFHALVQCDFPPQISQFMQVITSTYAHEFNTNLERKGSIFHKAFGNAAKKGRKKLISIICYILNNPVEKGLSSDVKGYRWNFIEYYNNPHPYSKKISKDKMSRALKRAISLIDKLSADNEYLKYYIINPMFKSIVKDDEREYLIDYIISSYSVIDYQVQLKYFDSYSDLIKACSSNTGGEYDIKEDWDPFAETAFPELIALTKKLGYKYRDRNFLDLDIHAKIELIHYFAKNSSANELLIAKFLHLKLEFVKSILTRY